MSSGSDITRGNFEDAFILLRDHYEPEENIFVRTQKFLSLIQAVEKDDRDYLLRVEQLSRDFGFGHNNQVKTRSTLVLVINGLRYSLMKKELMCKGNSDWETQKKILQSRSVAKGAAEVLFNNGSSSVKGEVGETRKSYNPKSSTYRRGVSAFSDDDYHRGGDHSRAYDKRSLNYGSDDYKHRCRSHQRSNYRGSCDFSHDSSHERRRRGERFTFLSGTMTTVFLLHEERDFLDFPGVKSAPRCTYYNRDSVSSKINCCHACGQEGHYKKICPETVPSLSL